jgi:aminotransferase
MGLIVDPEKEILVTSGATGAMSSACLALFDPGDQVILFEPFYGYHYSTLLSMRVEPVVVPLAPRPGRSTSIVCARPSLRAPAAW